MVTIRVVLHTLISRFILLLAIIVGLPFIILMMILPAHIRYQSKFLFWAIHIFHWVVIKATFVPISFEGLDHISKEPAIFVANHQSSLDIPLVAYVVRGKPHIWLARHELMRWKLLRWVLPRLSMVIDTTSKEKAMRSLINLIRFVDDKNVDIMIFPEGGRFPDDKVHPFYGGFVTLAKMLKRQVIPIYISGANKVYPPNTFWLQYHPIKVTVGKPLFQQPDESDEQFKKQVYEWFLEQSEG